MEDQSIAKLGFVRTLRPCPIPEEEGDGGSLITGSEMGDLNRYFCGSSRGILLAEWKSENDFLLVEVPGRFVDSRNGWNLKRTRPSGSSRICSISFICIDLSIEAR